MSITINAEKKSEIDAARNPVAEKNGKALDDRQKETARGEAAAFAKAGNFKAALEKVLELI